MNLASNSLVISGLALMCSLPLAYQLVSPDPVALSSGTLGGDGWAGGEGDAPAVGWYEGWVTHTKGMHACHWLECFFLALSASYNYRCFVFCFTVIGYLTIYTPTVDSKMLTLVDRVGDRKNIWFYPLMGMTYLFLALPFAAVRVSPAAMVCAAAPVVMFLYMFHWCYRIADATARTEHAFVRQVLAIDGGRGEGGRVRAFVTTPRWTERVLQWHHLDEKRSDFTEI